MSAELGLDPASLLELDGPMFDALERAAGRRWTSLEELVAQTLELAHVHYVSFLASVGVKGGRLPKPLRVPRPDAERGFELERPRVLSPLAFAAEFGPSSSSPTNERAG